MNALTRARQRSALVISTAATHALQTKSSGIMERMISPSMLASPSDWQQQSRWRESYALFRSWVYAAVNALASEAMQQPVNVGHLAAAEEEEKMDSGLRTKQVGFARRRARAASQSLIRSKMTRNIRRKAEDGELEMDPAHPLLKTLQHPNPLQHRQQFVYSFVANLNLTGRAYIVRDEGDDGPEYYSLPSTWVRPDHKEGPYSKFYVSNPRDLDFASKTEPLDASQVSFAYLPNPADPMGSLSPANSQSAAIRVDDRIQTCQEKFFDNGIFPSAMVIVGKDPHPDVPGGVRPRLTGAQRRQVYGAIRRVMGSVANYGSPVILDGLIENVLPYGRDQNELGWDKSEDKLKTRILSAFCVHPMILGEPLGVGGYAQAYVIKDRFYSRCNIFLDLLSVLMTDFVKTPMKKPKKAVMTEEQAEEDLMVWWEALTAEDPSMKWTNLRDARQRGDITRNEYRAELGFPPDEDTPEAQISAALGTTIQGTLVSVGMGSISKDQAQALFEGLGVPSDLAERIATPPVQPESDLMGMGDEQEQGGWPPEDGEDGGEEDLAAAADSLNGAVAALREPLALKVERAAGRVAGLLGMEQ